MTTFVLLHGSGDGGWAWHLVQPELWDLGHDAVAPDLPTDRADATWADVATAAAHAAVGAEDVVVVGHSAGGFAAPLAAGRLDARLVVHLAGLVPQPGESAADWFDHVGWTAVTDDGPLATYYHDVNPALAAEAIAHERPTSERLSTEPWPGPPWPPERTRYVVTAHTGSWRPTSSAGSPPSASGSPTPPSSPPATAHPSADRPRSPRCSSV
ncbi:alpha/beta fold hydrolase [Nocardioides sp. CCNWLW216]|uniref:alpha/beta fold hydrolase n=1 Tax=Nocardioides sp. CCNWLW216 TaxID=3125803 RepID=UPI003014AA7D